MNRRTFLGLLGLTGCIDINEDCMNISKKWWWLHGGSVSDPSINVDNQQVWAILGDSKAAGYSTAVGDTPVSGTVYQYKRDTSTIIEVGATDLLYKFSTGSQWPNFGINYYNNTGIKPIFVNCGLASSCFYETNAALSWQPSTGNLYPAAKTYIDDCMTVAGVTRLGGVLIVLGTNDIRVGTFTIANILIAAQELIDTINTDYDSPNIYISIPSPVITPDTRCGEVKKFVKELADNYSNIYTTVNEITLYANAMYFDNLHFNYDGNVKFAEMTAAYIASTAATKELKRILTCVFVGGLTTDEKTAYTNFYNSAVANGYYDDLVSLQIYRASSKANVLSDVISYSSALDSGFTFVANDKIQTDGVSTYLQSYFSPTAYNLETNGFYNYITGIGTKTMQPMAGVIATAFGSISFARTLLGKNASDQMIWHGTRVTANVYATNTQVNSDKDYAIKRTANNSAVVLENNTVLQTDTGISSNAHSGMFMIGCKGNGFQTLEFYQGEFTYFFYSKNASMNYTAFLTDINQLLTDLA